MTSLVYHLCLCHEVWLPSKDVVLCWGVQVAAIPQVGGLHVMPVSPASQRLTLKLISDGVLPKRPASDVVQA